MIRPGTLVKTQLTVNMTCSVCNVYHRICETAGDNTFSPRDQVSDQGYLEVSVGIQGIFLSSFLLLLPLPVSLSSPSTVSASRCLMNWRVQIKRSNNTNERMRAPAVITAVLSAASATDLSSPCHVLQQRGMERHEGLPGSLSQEMGE